MVVSCLRGSPPILKGLHSLYIYFGVHVSGTMMLMFIYKLSLAPTSPVRSIYSVITPPYRGWVTQLAIDFRPFTSLTTNMALEDHHFG